MSYDTLIRGGTVIDPAQKLNGRYDVAVKDGRIAAVEREIVPSAAAEVLDASGKLVLPGLIDTHAHVFQYVTGRFGLEADMCGVHSGVTTLIDQGGPSCMTLPAFREFVVNAEENAALWCSSRPISSAASKAITTRRSTSPIASTSKPPSGPRARTATSSRASRRTPRSAALRAGVSKS